MALEPKPDATLDKFCSPFRFWPGLRKFGTDSVLPLSLPLCVFKVYQEHIIDVARVCSHAAKKHGVKRFVQVSTGQVYDAGKVRLPFSSLPLSFLGRILVRITDPRFAMNRNRLRRMPS